MPLCRVRPPQPAPFLKPVDTGGDCPLHATGALGNAFAAELALVADMGQGAGDLKNLVRVVFVVLAALREQALHLGKPLHPNLKADGRNGETAKQDGPLCPGWRLIDKAQSENCAKALRLVATGGFWRIGHDGSFRVIANPPKGAGNRHKISLSAVSAFCG